MELVDTAVSSAAASRYAGSSPAERRKKGEDGSIANEEKGGGQQWGPRSPMYPGETRETKRGNRGPQGGGLGDEGAPGIDLETGGLGEWEKGDGEKREGASGRKVGSPRSECQGPLEQEGGTPGDPGDRRGPDGASTKGVWEDRVDVGVHRVRRGGQGGDGGRGTSRLEAKGEEGKSRGRREGRRRGEGPSGPRRGSREFGEMVITSAFQAEFVGSSPIIRTE